MIAYLLVWLICILIGALIGAVASSHKNAWILFGAICAAIISGVLLLVIWAMLAISQFFGIPLIIIIAIVIVVWFIFGRR